MHGLLALLRRISHPLWGGLDGCIPITQGEVTKEEAEERGLKVTTGKIPMTINARYLAEHPGERGLCKVVVEEGTRRLLGVHMIGGACSEMIFGAATMLETELREEEIDEIIFPHPTTSEVMKDVFMAVR